METIKTIITSGVEGHLIEVECYLSNSLPSIVIVGLGGKAVDESKERIRGALASARISLPRKRIVINLAPADIPKDSTSMDLAIAAAILVQKQATNPLGNDHAVIGELGLDGTIKPVRGIVGKLLAAHKASIRTCIIPRANMNQAMLVPDISIVPVATITELYLHLNGTTDLKPKGSEPIQPVSLEEQADMLNAIVGQENAKRALIISAAGGHNLLLIGPPGTGKTMLAKSLPTLLPQLASSEMLEITHLHSLTTTHYDQLITERPFRAPHHSASHTAIVGGGSKALPGEITLSHRGVLLLDEMPEFDRATLEALRQPLEDKVITVARAKQTVQYPADFILIATANPCPCGYLGSTKECTCSTNAITRYRRKLSGPILDRIDMHVVVEPVDHMQLLSVQPSKRPTYRVAIHRARQKQADRLGTDRLNATMNTSELHKYACLLPEAHTLLNAAATRLQLSARGYMRTLKVARTIADLDNSNSIGTAHISEALQYRSTDNLDA